MYKIATAAILAIYNFKNATTFMKCYQAEMESRGPEDIKIVKTSQAYFLKGSSHFLKISP